MTKFKDTKYVQFIESQRSWYGILKANEFDAMERMYNDGLTLAQIGRYFNVSAPNVHQIIKARRLGRGSSSAETF